MKHTLELLQPLEEILAHANSPLLKVYRACLSDPRLGQMRAKLDEYIQPETHYSKKILDMRTQKCFAVKTGMNGIVCICMLYVI